MLKILELFIAVLQNKKNESTLFFKKEVWPVAM